MTIEDGHFRSDRKTLEPCCKDMEGIIDYGDAILIDGIKGYCLTDGMYKPYYVGAKACLYCGAKLEYTEKVKECQ